MYLPPADALVPQSQTIGADEPMKYSDYRFIESEILARTNGLKVNDKSPINIPLGIHRTDSVCSQGQGQVSGICGY